MICIRTRYGKEVRLPAPDGVTEGTLQWIGGELTVPVVGGELVISAALSAQVPQAEQLLGETHCVLIAGSEQCVVIYITAPIEIKPWRPISD